MRNKKTIVYCLPKGKYHGIRTLADSVSNYLSGEYNFKKVQLSFLHFSRLKRWMMNIFPHQYTHYFLTPSDFNLSVRKTRLIEKGDLVHFWHPEFAGLFPQKKYLVSCHGIELLPKVCRHSGTSFFFSIFQKALFIHVDSLATRELLLSLIKKKKYIRNKIKVIYPCIDISRFKREKAKRQPTNRKPVIGTLARLVESKNVQTVVDALSYLQRDFNLKFRFILAGDGPEKGRILSKLSNNKIDFIYLGAISEEEKVEKFYHKIDVFVLPTWPSEYNREGFGLVYIEANASGVPVVASKDGGVVEAVNEGISGLFADFTDPNDIAQKILMLVKKRNDYFVNTVKWAERFDVNKYGPHFREIYRQALEK